MIYAKMLGLLAVAVAALAGFAAIASATTITSPTGTVYTSTITAENEEPISFDGSFQTVTCQKSHVSGSIIQHGAGVTVKGNISTLDFSECNPAVTVEVTGTFEIHAVITNSSTNKVEGCSGASGYCTGTVTFTGTKLKMHTSVGECVFTTSATDVGLLTPTNDTGATATLDIGAHKTGIIPRTAGNFLCGSSAQWTGSYKVTTPDFLWIDL